MTRRRIGGMFFAVLAGCVSLAATQIASAEDAMETISNVVYAEREDAPLKADVYVPAGEGPFPGVLCVHGGAWTIGSKTQVVGIARRLAKAGYTAVAINYRLAPKHKHPAQIDDCRDALVWMRANAAQYKIDTDRLAGWGYSAGAHLVTLLGVTDSGLSAVVAGGTPTDFRDTPADSRRYTFWLDGTRGEQPELYESASPAHFASADDPPVFFYHGQDDGMIPLRQPTALAAELEKLGVTATVHVVPDKGHIGVYLDRSVVAEGIKFLDEYLKPD